MVNKILILTEKEKYQMEQEGFITREYRFLDGATLYNATSFSEYVMAYGKPWIKGDKIHVILVIFKIWNTSKLPNAKTGIEIDKILCEISRYRKDDKKMTTPNVFYFHKDENLFFDHYSCLQTVVQQKYPNTCYFTQFNPNGWFLVFL
uniref:Uncharacterized protein n=1 Tax=viral metagenome TaxID=1070528 RepID=A0A6C0JR12_9ZZZZ